MTRAAAGRAAPASPSQRQASASPSQRPGPAPASLSQRPADEPAHPPTAPVRATDRPASLLPEWEDRDAPEWARRLGAATAEFHARIGSTSDRARELVRERRALPGLVVADRQTAGRGRQGRRWESDAPTGLWLTVVLAVARFAPAAVLPLRIGLAAARALESVAPGFRAQVKWPNDLTAPAGGKLGGVLCERVGDVLLAGIGVNLNHSRAELPPGLAAPATSLFLETGQAVSRGDALSAVWSAAVAACARSGRSLAPDEVAALDRRSPLRGRPVVVDGVALRPGEGARRVRSLRAVASGVAPDGSLLLRDDSGARARLLAGSVASWRRS